MDSNKVMHRRRPEALLLRPVTSTKDRKAYRIPTVCLEVNKVISLLEGPLTATLKERHLFTLKKLLQRSQNGFILKELSAIGRILNICAERAKAHPEYVSVLCDALKICGLPFLKERASDEIAYAYDVKEFLSVMGCLMRVPSVEVRHELCSSLKSFYSHVAPRHLLDGMGGPAATPAASLNSSRRFSRLSSRFHPSNPGYRLQVLEQSCVAETMVLSMATLEDQPAVRLLVLHTLQMMTSTSDANCAQILRARGAETVCLTMNQADPSGQALFRSSEVLWNLLERGCREAVTRQLSTMQCILALKEAFLHQLLRGSRQYDLQLRNDLLVITTLIAQIPKSPLIESLFAKQLVVFVTFPELKSHNPLVRNLKLTYNSEDFEMKTLLLNWLVCMSKDLSALQLFREGRVMLALLTLAKAPRNHGNGQSPRGGAGRHWSSGQQEALQLQALATLALVGPLLVEDYTSCQGNTCLLLLLEWCAGQDTYFGQGHSFHGAGGRGSKKAQMRYCVRALRSMTALEDELLSQDLCDQGAIGQLLGVLMQMEDGTPEEDQDPIGLEIKSDIQLVLSALCETDLHRKELFGAEGVEMAVHFLKMSPEKFHSGLGHNRLILSTVDCVWSCIVGCYTTEDYFLAREGVFLLLDLLSWSPRCMRGVVLATLLDLCDNPKTLSHVMTWTGSGGRTAPALLLLLWREEEAELGVGRDQHGRISDPTRPLLSCYQAVSDTSFSAGQPSPAVLDLSENLRAKVFSIFCKLGFHDLHGLSTTDHVTLSIVKRYLDFKVGEVWGEVIQELALEGVRPVRPDAAALEAMRRIAEDTASRVAEEQSAILERQEKDELTQEEMVYNEIKSRQRQQELNTEAWDQYVSRTSDYKVLQEFRSQREKTMDLSRSKSKPDSGVRHPSENFVGRVLNLDSAGELTLERVPLRGVAQQAGGPPGGREPEYFSTVSVT
ncbi:cilia- and flagella-associated protein 69 isoform X1 [Gadus morhua]|uniref:cilia- and flagella-associated protein 69 isoform X1 n=1 Tax=Gadus morhua TaxID=8049 RepID=UPI0011B7D58A|nr:cilia- and flagella-associated protein 69 isoform X1 [Gadus morhua]